MAFLGAGRCVVPDHFWFDKKGARDQKFYILNLLDPALGLLSVGQTVTGSSERDVFKQC